MPKKANEKENIIEKKIIKKTTTKKTEIKPKKLESKTDIKDTNSKITTKPKKSTSTSTKKLTTKTNIDIVEKKHTSKHIIEYYDLPLKYNSTVVKLLAQTPTTLFVYWDISESDRLQFLKEYGDNFFNDTIAFLSITNTSLNYSFDVEINDFANCWYLNVNDANCKYSISLKRKFKDSIGLDNNGFHIKEIITITSSNHLDAPNDRILFETLKDNVTFRNIKTNKTYEKNVLVEYSKHGIYTAFDTYKAMYQDDIILEHYSHGLTSS